jgi:hypothetical protein
MLRSRRLGRRWSLPAVSIIALAGCPSDREYVYTQTEPGLAMTAPIVHTVRVRISLADTTVLWLQDLRDSKGVETRVLRTYGGTPFSSCEIFDDADWMCSFLDADAKDRKPLERPSMKHGKLTRWYWGHDETYETKYRLFGLRF